MVAIKSNEHEKKIKRRKIRYTQNGNFKISSEGN